VPGGSAVDPVCVPPGVHVPLAALGHAMVQTASNVLDEDALEGTFDLGRLRDVGLASRA
jgi:hypothetical protein